MRWFVENLMGLQPARVLGCTFISNRALLICLAAIGVLLIVAPLNAACTEVRATPYSYEADLCPGVVGYSVSNQQNVMDHLYGPGNYTRIDDDNDQLWLNSGNAKVKAVAKFGASAEVGLWYVGDGLSKVLVATNQVPYMTDTWHNLPNAKERFFWKSAEVPCLGDKYSVPTKNSDGVDHMVTFRVNADSTHPERWVIAWEQGVGGGNDHDYQDIVFEVVGAQPVPKPSVRQGREKTISVNSATEAWQDSGVDVVSGQTIKVTASGKVFHQWYGANNGPPGYADPDGVGLYGDGANWKGAGPQLKSDTILPSAIALSLIGKVGGTTAFGTGTPVPEGAVGKGAGFVGSSYCQNILTTGRLFFAFNDELRFFGDNSGSFEIAVEVVSDSSARPSTQKHVRELARYLDGVKIAEPVMYRQLSVYPILVEDVPLLRGRWLTLDKAISQGILEVSEKPGGRVPLVRVGNKSQDENVLIMTGEVIAGGMQTRTIRRDVVLAPGQTIDLDVFCVEARRWAGEEKFSRGSKTMLPQSIQGELRKGCDQSKVWSEVARNNSSLRAENSTGSLEVALNSPQVRKDLEDARRKIVPQIPSGTVGFIFVDRGRALGAEFFGSEDLARELLPKLLDSYVVDYVILRDSGFRYPDGKIGPPPGRMPPPGGVGSDHEVKSDNRAAIDFFEQLCRAGSQREPTPGSGAGIRTRPCESKVNMTFLLGDGVSLDDTPVHFGVQYGERSESKPIQRPRPSIIYP
jgi:hypothetical protein